MQEPVPFVLCFDVEPDEIEVSPGARPWLGFERMVERSKEWREAFAAATGRPVRFGWYLRMDPQIAQTHGSACWAVDRYGAVLDRLRAQGDVIGLHPHDWRWSPSPGRWVADHGDAEWIDDCVRMSYDAYRSAFGEACRAQRFGDRFLSARAIRLAGELGALYDLTVEPGARSVTSMHPGTAATGRTADMTRCPLEPYRPNRGDPLLPGDGTVWMVPLTSMDPDPVIPHWRRMGRRVRYPRRPTHRPATLTARWPAGPFWSIIERDLAGRSRPHLAFAVRSAASLDRAHPLERKIAALVASPLARRLAFTTPDHVVGAGLVDASAANPDNLGRNY